MGILKKTKKTDSTTAPEMKAEKTDVVSAHKAGNRGAAYRVLMSPLLSEKTTRAESTGTYTFSVAMTATKPEIIQAVERVYGIRPKQVRTVVVEGKEARFGRQTGRRIGWKKAYVTLPKGSTISIHTGV